MNEQRNNNIDISITAVKHCEKINNKKTFINLLKTLSQQLSQQVQIHYEKILI